jgi:hypothetical protein
MPPDKENIAKRVCKEMCSDTDFLRFFFGQHISRWSYTRARKCFIEYINRAFSHFFVLFLFFLYFAMGYTRARQCFI